MRPTFFFPFFFLLFSAQEKLKAQTTKAPSTRQLFIDVHQLKPGTVSADDVAKAHAKDLAVQSKYGVEFLKYWVDEANSLVYCLSAARDSASITGAHREAHGLLPQRTYPVTEGKEALPLGSETYFLDVHNLGAGNVTAAAVAEAHEKDLAAQKKNGVRFLNYWVNEANGVVFCLSQAKDAANVVQTHKEAHGLLPQTIAPVKQGQ